MLFIFLNVFKYEISWFFFFENVNFDMEIFLFICVCYVLILLNKIEIKYFILLR